MVETSLPYVWIVSSGIVSSVMQGSIIGLKYLFDGYSSTFRREPRDFSTFSLDYCSLCFQRNKPELGKSYSKLSINTSLSAEEPLFSFYIAKDVYE